MEVGKSSTKGVGFAHREELHEECRGTLVPCVDSFPVLVEPLFHPPSEREREQAESDYLWCDTLHNDGVSQHQEVLEMCVGILARQSIEWICLHHCD